MSGVGRADADAAFEEVFAELRREYLAEGPVRVEELRKELAAFRAGEPGSRLALAMRLHRLAGSGGSYGFPEISEVSRTTEQWLRSEPGGPLVQQADQVEQAVERIAAAFEAAQDEVGAPTPEAWRPPFASRALVRMAAGREREAVVDALQAAGYVTMLDLGAEPAVAEAGGALPDVVVVGADAAGLDPYALASTWATGRPARPRAVVLVLEEPALDRLRAAAAGVDAVFTPEQAPRELAGFAGAVARLGTPPAQVLVVDAVATRADRIARELESARLRVRLCTTPDAALKALDESLPDLVLAAVRLPETDGLTLVRRLRQDARLTVLPLVLYTEPAENGPEAAAALHAAALRAGADDFLSLSLPRGAGAPGGPGGTLLRELAVTRAERGRWMRQLVHRDGLTGLLNHATFMAELEYAVEYGRRQGDPFALLLVDLDHFRRVNDAHGHLEGDRVLAHVAWLLRASVRACDHVARWGGEEFALLLHDATPQGVEIVAEKLRRALAGAAVEVEGAAPLLLSASMGAAVFPTGGATPAELARSADRALRAAKAEGRDRVVIAG